MLGCACTGNACCVSMCMKTTPSLPWRPHMFVSATFDSPSSSWRRCVYRLPADVPLRYHEPLHWYRLLSVDVHVDRAASMLHVSLRWVAGSTWRVSGVPYSAWHHATRAAWRHAPRWPGATLPDAAPRDVLWHPSTWRRRPYRCCVALAAARCRAAPPRTIGRHANCRPKRCCASLREGQTLLPAPIIHIIVSYMVRGHAVAGYGRRHAAHLLAVGRRDRGAPDSATCHDVGTPRRSSPACRPHPCGWSPC